MNGHAWLVSAFLSGLGLGYSSVGRELVCWQDTAFRNVSAAWVMSLQVCGAAWEQGVWGKNTSSVQCEEAEKLAGVRELGAGP